MPRKMKDITGYRYTRLIALSFSHHNSYRAPLWLCQCDCGTKKLVSAWHLERGTTQSCGCLQRERLAASVTTHGLSSHPMYKLWCSMRQRCDYSNDPSYPRYGGRGITVCERWNHDFAAFLADMGERPDGTTLNRINNDGPYSPENCEWATFREQARNSRNARLIEYNGESLSIVEWAERLNAPDYIVSSRLLLGWTVERTLTTPYKPRITHKCRLLKYAGQELTIAEWARETGIKQDTIYARLRYGWSVSDVLTRPLGTRCRQSSS